MFPIFEGTNSLEYTSIYNFADVNFHDSRKNVIKHFLKRNEF